MANETILITRPASDDMPLNDALHARGYRTIHEPMTNIVLIHTALAAIEHAIERDPEAIIVTSQNAVHALAALHTLRDVPLICVGSATEDAALRLGFTRSSAAGGDVNSLIAYITAAYDPESYFLYVSAQHIRTDLAEELSAYGMQIERVIAYEALASQHLSDTVIEQIRRGYVDGVTFFSQRSAETFISLVQAAKLEEATASMQAFALSEAVATPLAAWPFKSIHTADEATLASMVECVDNAFNLRK